MSRLRCELTPCLGVEMSFIPIWILNTMKQEKKECLKIKNPFDQQINFFNEHPVKSPL